MEECTLNVGSIANAELEVDSEGVFSSVPDDEELAVSSPPPQPKIYHITHGKNLGGILTGGCLWSDMEMARRGGPETSIGLPGIKKRRLHELAVDCHPGTKVGEFVPFNFCPRSVMLFILHRGNYPELTYQGGQRAVVHLEADLHEVVAWADSQNRAWAFTDCNAGSRYFHPFHDLSHLDRLNWDHIAATEWSDKLIKDAKQAEFLIYGSFPWMLVRSIGVLDEQIASRVRGLIAQAHHRPDVRAEPTWYY
jgi:hypothetical protein